MALLKSMRPRQWVKNGFVLAPLAFAGVDGLRAPLRVVLATVAFCAISSGLYLVNDILDRERDRSHPEKRNRPIASGRLPISYAVGAAIALTLAGLATCAALSLTTFGWACCYVAITLSYSLWFKHVAILDVMLLASGFVIRVLTGSEAGGFPASEWLLVCTGALALFLGFGKRRHELVTMKDKARDHRPILEEYTVEALTMLVLATAVIAIIAFALYTLTSETAIEHPQLALGTPFVVFGVFRYILLLGTDDKVGAPEEILLRDHPTLLAVFGWAVVSVLAVYGGRIF